MTKLPHFFDQNPLVISQSPHTQEWGGKYYPDCAIDFAYTGNFYAPLDGVVKTWGNSASLGRQAYFTFHFANGFWLIVVHAKPLKVGNVKQGEKVGVCTWHHYHITLVTKEGKFENVLEYLDRNRKLVLTKDFKQEEQFWADWKTYPDKTFPLMSNDLINSIFDQFTKKWNNRLPGFWADDGNNFGSLRGRWYQGQYQEALDPLAEEIERLQKENKEQKTQIKNLELLLQEAEKQIAFLEEKVEEEQAEEKEINKERWDWDKFLVGLSKSQIIQKILVYSFAFLLVVISQKYPEYEQIFWFLAGSMGIGGEITALQNNWLRLKKVNKIQEF